MTDENNQEIAGEEPQAPHEAQEPQQPTEAQAPKGEEASETDEVKKGAGQRIRELNQQVKSLTDRVAELTQTPDTKEYQPNVQPGEEITPQRYSEDVTRTADSVVNLRMKQLQAKMRLETETANAIRDFPQLDPKSQEFDPELSETITEAVEAHIRVNPYSASVTRFVGKLMKPYAKAVEREVGQVRENIAKQVTQTALRPTQVKATEKTANDMSVAELERKLGIIQS